MPHYPIKYTEPNGDTGEVSVQTSDPDAAVSIFKRQFPGCEIKDIKSGPDLCIITNCGGSRSILLHTPFVRLNVPNSWELDEFAALIAHFHIYNVKTPENEYQTGQMVVVYDDALKSLLSPLMDAMKARL